jgi:hypothetical protein
LHSKRKESSEYSNCFDKSRADDAAKMQAKAKIGDREEEFIQAKHIMEDYIHAACVNKYLPMSTPRIHNVMLFILSL